MPENGYRVYKITSPDGKAYVGLTRTSLNKRWWSHITLANQEKLKLKPLGQAIRTFGKENFTLEILSDNLTRQEGELQEIHFISLYKTTDPEYGYNTLSGDNTVDSAGHLFWREIKKNPEEFENYRKKLSEACKNGLHMQRIPEMTRILKQWREDNPDKLSEIARNVAATKKAKMLADPVKAAEYEAKQARIARTIRRSDKQAISDMSREYVTRIWENRPTEVKAEIGQKISASLKIKNATKSDEEKIIADAQLADARKNIDKAKWKENIAAGRVAYWTPERRAAKAEETRLRFKGTKRTKK